MFTPSALKARADVPSQANISEGAGYIRCVNVSRDYVKNILGSATTSIIGICRHANVNRWSGFGPTVRSVSGGGSYAAALVNSLPTQCKLLDFAGYDHHAQTPGWWNLSNPKDVYVNAGTQAQIEITPIIGQVKWEDLGATHLAVVLFDNNGVVQGFGQTALSGIGENAMITVTSTYAINTDKNNWYVVAYLMSQPIINPIDDLPWYIVCKVPNCNASTVRLYAIAQSYVKYGDTGTLQPPSPWVNNNGPLGWNRTTGYVTIGYDLESANNWANVRVYAVLTNYLGQTISTVDIFNGPYYALDSVYGSVYLGMTNIPDYGYFCNVYIAYTN